MHTVAREVQDGVPVIPGADGLRPDPLVSLDDGYGPGVGTRESGEMVPGDDDGESEVEEPEMGSRKRKKGKRVKTKGPWKKVVNRGAVLKKDVHQLVASLTAISCIRPESELFALVKSLTSPLSAPSDSGWVFGSSVSSVSAIAALVTRIEKLSIEAKAMEFRCMILLMQLALLIDYEQHISNIPIARVHRNSGVSCGESYFRVLYNSGCKFIWLASSASVYIIFVIAALELRKDVANSNLEAIKALAAAFREPPSDEWRTVLVKVLIPRLRILQLQLVPAEFVDNMLYIPSPSGPQYVKCSNLKVSDEVFGTVKMHAIQPVPRSAHWAMIPPSIETTIVSSPVASSLVREALVIKAPWAFVSTPCPVNVSNRSLWTALEREKAEKRLIPASIEELTSMINAQVPLASKGEDPPKIGGFIKTHPYIGVPSTVLAGNTLRVEDVNGDLIALAVTHVSSIPALKSKLEVLMAEIQLVFPGELYTVDTIKNPNSKFLAFHFSWYNKFSESGAGAPVDTHPSQLLREGAWKVNWGQREPRESQQIRDHPSLYRQMKDIMEDILVFIKANIQYHLPQAYKELEVHGEVLPGNEASPVHSFTSMVVNLCVMTNGHRDHGDKKWCATFTIGQFEGGQESFLYSSHRGKPTLIFM
ncbi:hypothetical protein HWV62_15499 [Athelia sp. TMB]|nr:hypothetical protein HWV62_15499 [Athelia sp. TMB]